MVFSSATPYTTLYKHVPLDFMQAVEDRVAAMNRRRSIQDRLARIRAIQAERGA